MRGCRGSGSLGGANIKRSGHILPKAEMQGAQPRALLPLHSTVWLVLATTQVEVGDGCPHRASASAEKRYPWERCTRRSSEPVAGTCDGASVARKDATEAGYPSLRGWPSATGPIFKLTRDSSCVIWNSQRKFNVKRYMIIIISPYPSSRVSRARHRMMFDSPNINPQVMLRLGLSTRISSLEFSPTLFVGSPVMSPSESKTEPMILATPAAQNKTPEDKKLVKKTRKVRQGGMWTPSGVCGCYHQDL